MVASPQPPYSLEALTRQELVVLSLLARGMTNNEIAESLHLANGTVKAHVSAILRKLGARNRTEAALMYTRPSDAVWPGPQPQPIFDDV